MSVDDTDLIPPTIGERVAQERERQGISQADFAKRYGLSLRRLKAIEAGTGRPMDFLFVAYLADCNADLSYILIGRRSPCLSLEEREFLGNFRELSGDDRGVALRMVSALAGARQQ